MASREVNLTDDLAAFVDRQVEVGRHRDASEVVREALRRYVDDVEGERGQGDEAALTARLRRAWAEGVESGSAGVLDFKALKVEARARLRRNSKG